MRLPVIAAALAALAAFSADARPNPYGPGTSVGDVYGGSAWFNDYVGGVAVTGSTLAECQQRLRDAIAARSNWAVTSLSPCAKWQPYIRISNIDDVKLNQAEVGQVLRIDSELRQQFRIDQYDQAFEASFPTVLVCE